jgi:hypothetical protein
MRSVKLVLHLNMRCYGKSNCFHFNQEFIIFTSQSNSLGFILFKLITAITLIQRLCDASTIIEV